MGQMLDVAVIRTPMFADAPKRHVYVLGADAAFDVDQAARRSAVEQADLVLICIGSGLSASQRAIVARSLTLCAELRCNLDAEWVLSDERLRAVVEQGGELTVLAEERDERWVQAVAGDLLR
jgi:hypothetical protein